MKQNDLLRVQPTRKAIASNARLEIPLTRAAGLNSHSSKYTVGTKINSYAE